MQFKEFRGNIPIAINVPSSPVAVPVGGAFVVPNNMLIKAASMVWGASIAGVATNFFTISFFNRGSGAGTVQWGTAIAYSNGVNATKATPVPVTLSSTATDLQLAAGDVVSIEITHSGTGLICPGGTLMLTAQNR